MAAHYEALRAAVTGENAHDHPALRARALLVRKGMVTWMHSVGEATTPRVGAPRRMRAEPALPAGGQQQLVDILATMALASVMEIAP